MSEEPRRMNVGPDIVDAHSKYSRDRAMACIKAQRRGDERALAVLATVALGIDAFNAELHKRMGSPPQWPWWQDLKN